MTHRFLSCLRGIEGGIVELGWGRDITSVVWAVGNNSIEKIIIFGQFAQLREMGAWVKIRAFRCLRRIHTRLPQVVGMDHPAVAAGTLCPSSEVPAAPMT